MYIYCEDKTCTNGTVTFTPVVGGIPLFSEVLFASASGEVNSSAMQHTVLCGVQNLSATSVVFNCVAGTGILLGGTSLVAANNIKIRCFIVGKENPSVLSNLTNKWDGVTFYKV